MRKALTFADLECGECFTVVTPIRDDIPVSIVFMKTSSASGVPKVASRHVGRIAFLPDALVSLQPRSNAPATPNGRTVEDAIREAEELLERWFDECNVETDAWVLTRITKIIEALADRPR